MNIGDLVKLKEPANETFGGNLFRIVGGSSENLWYVTNHPTPYFSEGPNDWKFAEDDLEPASKLDKVLE